MQDRSRN